MSAESDRPDLLVPVDVAALTVAKRGTEWADHRPSFAGLDWGKVLGEQLEPGLFVRKELHPPGVHLHWALPDGLCHGESPSPDSEPRFPLIPNRWLLVRLQRPAGTAAAPACRAWVVESDSITDKKQGKAWPGGALLDPPDPGDSSSYVRYVGRVTELADWQESRPPRVEITALGYGDPSFAASYVASRGILGFHDELTDLSAAAGLDYFVAGWYADPDRDDPLSAVLVGHAASDPYETVAAVGRFLEERRWVYHAQEGHTQALEEAQNSRQALQDARATLKRLEQLGAANENGGGPFADTLVQEEGRMRAVEELRGTITGLEGEVAAQTSRLADLASRLPGRILCHGMVAGVRWAGGTASVEDGVPGGDPPPVVAVGETAVEAFGAVLQGLQPDLVRLLEAFQHGFLADFAAPGGYDTIGRKLHEQTFRPHTRGLRWGIRDPSVAAAPASPDDRSPSIPGDVRDLLEELNLQQAEIDRRKRELDGIRRELYATWYRWVAATGGGETQAALAKRRDGLLDELERLSRELAEREESGTGRPRGGLWDRVRAEMDKLLPGFALEAVDDVRFWRPRDPVVLLAGPAFRPSPRHGQDGRYRKDGRLACRLSGEEAAAVRVANVPDADPGEDGSRVLDPGVLGLACDSFAAMCDRLPAGIAALLDECVLLTAPTSTTGGAGLAAAIRAQLPAHLERFWPEDRRSARGELDMRCLPEHRAQDCDWRLTGRFPSLVACNRWSGNPWLPLFLQWQVEWIPQAAAGLEGGEWDDLGTGYRWPRGQTPGKKQTYEGSTLLTPSVAASLGRQLRRSDLTRRLPGLEGLASEVAGMDLLCQALAGFTDRLLMHRSRWEPPPLDPGASGPVPSTIASAVAGIDRIAPVIDSSLLPLRAGRMRLVKLWVVDAFGQVLELPGPTPQAQNRLARPALPARLRGTDEGLQLEPRLAQGARLIMEWPPARSGSGACGHDPICGWILPNLLDASLSIYDARGNALGALQAVRHLSREAGAGARWEAVESFHWVDVPGSKRSYYGQAPGKITEPLGPDADPGLQAFTAGLLSLTGMAGRAFGALLDAIDEALGADRSASSAMSAGLALLIGQPLALVRARLRLELDGPPALDQGLADVQSPPDGGIGAVRFPVRLGDRRAWNGTWLGDDGLVGYFLDGQYGRFYPAFGLSAPAEIDYLKFRHQPLIAVDKPLELTLLLDPSRGVCVSSGILPRAHFSLPYADAAEVLEHKEVFFYTGPLVSPQEPLRIPEPSDIYGEWSWTHRPRVQVWHAPQAVVDIRNERARFLDDRMRLAEGWLRLVTAPLQIRTFGIRGLKPVAPEQDASGESGREAPVSGGPKDALFAEYEAPAAHPLVLSWAVTGADEIRLCRDGEELLKTGRHPLPTRYRLPSATETLLTLTATTRPTGGAAPDECTAHVRVRVSGER